MVRSGGRDTPPWLGRYELPTLLRSRGAFHLGTTRERSTGEARVVIVGAPERHVAGVRSALGALERAHRRLAHPKIARVAESGEHEGAPFVALDCEAVVDFGVLLREAGRLGLRVPHAEGDGFIRGLREALQSAHRVLDDAGQPTCIGTLSYGNVLFGRSGQHWLVGFGHNVVTLDEEGGPLGGESVYQAPETSVGGAASPQGDFVALITMMRSLVPGVELAQQVGRVLVGRSLPEDLELARCLLWFERRVVAALPTQRASIEEAIKVSDRIRALLGVTPDPEGFERTAAAALRRFLPEQSAARGELRVGPDGAWMEAPDGSYHALGTRTALRRILLVLAEERLRRPGAVLPMGELIAAGWPGERLLGETGTNRAYVLLSALRRMGLRGALQRHDHGYRLDPALVVRLESGESSSQPEPVAPRST